MTKHVFLVLGEPIPQGSKSATARGGRAVLFEANKKLKPWRETITRQVRHQFNGQAFEPGEPIRARILFTLTKPASVKRLWPTAKPDVDKLTRAIFDGVADAGVFAGDQQIIAVTAFKVYAEPGEPASALIVLDNETVTNKKTLEMLRKLARNALMLNT